MNELKMCGVKSDAGNSSLKSLCRVVFSVTDDRMADRGKLHPDLVLQSSDQRNPDQRCGSKTAFDEIPKLGASALAVTRDRQFLEHSFTSKVVNESSFFGAEISANHCEILPHRAVLPELPNQGIPVPLGFCKEKNARRKTIDAMYDKRSLPSRFQFC